MSTTLRTILRTFYRAMQSEAFHDPIMRALFNGEISWAEAYTEEDEANWIEYTTTGEGAEFLAAFQVNLEKANQKASKKSKKVHWIEEPTDVPNVDRSPVQIHQTTTTVVFNPQQVKTIVARNLPRDTTADELQNVFAKHGPVRDVYIPKNLDKNSPYYGTIKGFALVKFMSATDSTRAYMAETTNLYIRGKMIGIEFAKEDR